MRAPSDTVILWLDHHAGLFQTVQDISVADLRAHTTLLATVATRLKIPVITTASEPHGLARMAQAGVIPTSAHAVLSEMHRTWNRPEAAELAKLYALATPHSAAVIESDQKAQDVLKPQTKSAWTDPCVARSNPRQHVRSAGGACIDLIWDT